MCFLVIIQFLYNVILGFVEWKEYYKHFLLAKGHELKETEKYLEDYDTDILKDDGETELVWIHTLCQFDYRNLLLIECGTTDILVSMKQCRFKLLIFFPERDQLVRYKFKWTDADIAPIDNKLDKSEFFSFRHPEHSPQLIENMISSIINSLGIGFLLL